MSTDSTGMENTAESSKEGTEDSKIGMDSKENGLGNRIVEKKRKKKQQKMYSLIPKFGCMRLDDDDDSTEEKPGSDGSFNVEATSKIRDRTPTHLVVMVNGIIGSSQDWKYAAKHFARAFPNDVIVHCSQANASMLTFDGVDVMGTRLADEVISLVGLHPNLQKISFVGHSLGGLVARYAIAKLYRKDLATKRTGEENEENGNEHEKKRANICGLEPVNFITVATPHLGSRGHRQVPVFCGFYSMEIFATRASWLLGRTGKHLFLCDSENGKPPLLLRMSSDSEDLLFISALQSFERRVAYANVRFDHLVGWSSSSLRRRNELPKRRHLLKNAEYPHIVFEEESNMANPQNRVSLDVVKISRRRRTHDMEETMIEGLKRLSWERVDISFSGSAQRFFAHNTIQVKTYCINSHGADVIKHMIDHFQL